MKKVLLVLIMVSLISVGIYLQSNKTKSVSQIKRTDSIAQTELTRSTSGYTVYSKNTFESATDKKRVLFFHAVWCPTCKVADEEFTSESGRIPEDVILLKTDYDSESELKKKYNITYQHTFVLVDDQGNEIKKWNGGGIEELIENTR